ncbi:MAG: 2-C-methyl-D-erythritol 2,4-cyclodiphosphate synthase [Thermoguttaceae bacterium]|nr:2-C-methyl-D-erythritol 2,4-cyclodiphosphate synthase [Thermoguttaceae bacterium]
MYRVGIGHDTHRLVKGRKLLLGGVEVPHSLGLSGHSDADVLLHAVTDALLGAAGRGDIGDMFPDTDEQNRNRNSAEFLEIVWQQLCQDGWQIENLDTIIFAERPKLGAYKTRIRDNIAVLLGLEPSQVNVKAKTAEKTGPVGRQEIISAEAAVLLFRANR